MKKQMMSVIALVLILLVDFSFNVQASNVEIDPHSYIGMPNLIANGNGTISVSSSAGSGYSLYYQKIDVSDAIYEQVDVKNSESQVYINTEKPKIDAERARVENLQRELNEISSNPDSAGADLAEKQEEYTTALNNYNQMVEDFNLRVKNFQKQVVDLMPDYQDDKWVRVEGTSNNVNIDLSNYSGSVHFALWAKLETSSGTYYDVDCYSSEGTKQSTTISLDKTRVKMKISETFKLNATTNSTEPITWSSSQENIATVDSNGNVTAISEGTTTITATVEGKSVTCIINVTKESTNAEDLSNIKFSYTARNLITLDIKISDCSLEEGCEYGVIISKDKNEDIGQYEGAIGSIYKNGDGTFKAQVINESARLALEYSGTNYIFVVKKNKDANEWDIVKGPLEMPQINSLGLGNRMNLWLYEPEKTIFRNSIYVSEDRKIEYRIGKVTSNDILKLFKNDSIDLAFSKLLDYAKNSDYLSTGIINQEDLVDGELSYNLVNKLNIEKDAYYFVYLIADDQNGKYIYLEDVNMYAGFQEDGKNILTRISFANIDINEDNNNGELKQDQTVAPGNKLPQTGISCAIVISIVLIASIGIVAYIKYRKYRNI